MTKVQTGSPDTESIEGEVNYNTFKYFHLAAGGPVRILNGFASNNLFFINNLKFMRQTRP